MKHPIVAASIAVVRSLPRHCRGARISALLLFALGACAPACGTRDDDVTIEGARQALATSVFINELHYDNSGTDAGEAIEVAGPAGTNLAGYRIVLYNGNGGIAYADNVLSGAIPDQGGGFGVVSIGYAANGVQNGSPDGVALVDPLGGVVQFLSYEGSFTAVGGPADGLLSTDIGVAENGTELLGQSLQLVGTGASYEAFTWAPASNASFGAINAGQRFTSAEDRPPSVASTTPAGGSSDVALNAAIAISFDEPVAVAGDWFEIACSVSGTHAAVVSGGPSTYVLTPSTAFAGAEMCTVTVFAAQVTDLDGASDVMIADFSSSFATRAESICGAPATRIHDVQGAGATSPRVGSSVTIEAVLVGDYQGSSGLGGFFAQELDDRVDADPETSEGIFVAEGSASTPVRTGDVVRLTGTVAEAFGLTQIVNVRELSVCASGASIAPTRVSLPVAELSDLEAFEGMLVTFPQVLTATDTFTLGRFGEVSLSASGRLMQPTNVAEPGSAAQALQAANDRSRIQLDDGSNVQNPSLVPHVASDGTLRVGDTVQNLSGVLSFAFGSYELHPVAPVGFTRANPRPSSPPQPGGSVRVASFNVLNYFTTLDSGPAICGPSGGLDCRGANSASEFTRQRDKILAALSAIDTDVVGLIELENNARASIEDLVNGLNSRLGAGTYAFIDTGTIGTDAIKVGLIYKPRTVAPVGSFAVLTSAVDPSFVDTLNRPVLAQTFAQLSTGEALTVAVNHLKSKGSACSGDADAGDGQGNCNQTRTQAARAEIAWLATDPTASGDSDFLIVGDLNAYAQEDPIDAFREAGYTDLIARFLGANAYSFVFQGQSGYLDHALASPSLAAKVVGASEWHINADEPVFLDYNQEFNPPSAYNPGPFRSADHDPLIVGFELRTIPAVPTCEGRTATIYVSAEGRIVGGPLNGSIYAGLLIGGGRGSVIAGTPGNDVIRSGARGDVVCGLGGNDVLLGSVGRDTLSGGDGNDWIQGGAGADVLSGGAGRDTLQGGIGVDSCDGGADADTSSGCEARRNIP